MTWITTSAVLLTTFAVGGAETTEGAERPEPGVTVQDWGKTLAVRSQEHKDVMMCLWFYEWHMFDAVVKGQHTLNSEILPWAVENEGKTAVIDRRGMKLHVKAVADGAELLLEVTNDSEHDWPTLASIVPCFNPGSIRGPDRNSRFIDDQHERTFYLGPDGLELLDDRALHCHDTKREGILARAPAGDFLWSTKWPLSDQDATGGLMIREGRDGQWVAGIAWERFLSCQGHNPWKCMHLSVNVGPLKRAETRTIRGRIYLFQGTKEQCLSKYRHEFCNHREETSKAKRPNILFVMSDDHCARAVGAYGLRLANLNPTPHLDALAREGMLFENVFCTNSICTPSRASVLTGQYSHRNGVYDLYDTLPGDRLYLPQEMKKAGYTTAVIGKWHLKDSPESFDYYAVIAGQGRYMNPVIHTSEGGEVRRVRFDSTLVREIQVQDTEGHSSDVLTDMTLDWLGRRRDKSKPFFLMHHFKAPHDMFVYAPRYEDYLADVEIPEPSNLYDQPGPDFGSIATRGVDDSLVGLIGSTISPQKTKRNLTRHYRNKIYEFAGRKDLSDRELTHHAYQMYVKEYLRCVKGIDDNLKRIIDYLRDNDLLENTVIVYTSDQGMLLGEHDYIDKRWMYEESIRMPLIVRYPKMVAAGSRCDWLINNTDFAPTLLGLAGIKRPDYMQGHSFVGALQGASQPHDWRKASYYRYWMHMAHGHNNPGHFGIRTKRHKLIFFYGTDYTDTHNGRRVTDRDGNRFGITTPAAWEFYDLERDPHEMHNRYHDADYRPVIQSLKAELKSLRDELGDTDSSYPRIRKIIDDHWDDR